MFERSPSYLKINHRNSAINATFNATILIIVHLAAAQQLEPFILLFI